MRRFSVATPAEADELTERLLEHLEDGGFTAALEAALATINADRSALHDLHEAQAWRLAWWRTAREKLTYRRFFEIADLIGVRQESRRVFRESHQLVIRLARERRLDGIRIDHVDGLADPKGYLEQLRQAFQSVRRSPTIHVEKILTGDERLRTTWEIEGTTGYEFITALGEALTAPLLGSAAVILFGGALSSEFWLGVVVIGLLAPALIELYYVLPRLLHGKHFRASRGVAIVVPAALLVGGFLLRYVVVIAGQVTGPVGI